MTLRYTPTGSSEPKLVHSVAKNDSKVPKGKVKLHSSYRALLGLPSSGASGLSMEVSSGHPEGCNKPNFFDIAKLTLELGYSKHTTPSSITYINTDCANEVLLSHNQFFKGIDFTVSYKDEFVRRSDSYRSIDAGKTESIRFSCRVAAVRLMGDGGEGVDGAEYDYGILKSGSVVEYKVLDGATYELYGKAQE